MMNLEDRLNFVWHNGVKVEYSMLVTLAKGAGDYALAQPYLVSLLAHGLVYGYSDYIDLVNEIRAYYQVAKIPVPKQEAGEKDGQKLTRQQRLDAIRKKYLKMSTPEKELLLQKALTALRENHPNIFRRKNHWLGIYLVCLYHTDKRKSLFRQMSREDVLLRINDPENLILVYLVLKAVVVVLGHFFAALTDLSLLMRYFN
jgi:hypothetical protein